MEVTLQQHEDMGKIKKYLTKQCVTVIKFGVPSGWDLKCINRVYVILAITKGKKYEYVVHILHDELTGCDDEYYTRKLIK